MPSAHRYEVDTRSTHAGERISPFLRRAQARMLDIAEVKAWTRIVSVECADGWAAEEAWRRAGRAYVCGVDTSRRMVELARDLRGIEGQIDFQVWDGRSLPLDDASFDVAFTGFGFQRFPEPFIVLREIRRVLRPGGKLLLLEPDRHSFYGLYALLDLFYRWTNSGHVRYYSTRQLVRMMRRADFAGVARVFRQQELLRGGKLLATATVITGLAGESRASQAGRPSVHP